MSRFHSHLNSAATILGLYKGNEPFAQFLKKYFAAEKKFGSRDRRQVSQLCYAFFRLGKNPTPADLRDRILAAVFLCSQEKSDMLEALYPAYNEEIESSLEEKWHVLENKYSITEIFPWRNLLSEGIEPDAFYASFLVQPDFFLRIRPGHEKSVAQKLQTVGKVEGSVVRLPNGTKVESLIDLDRQVVVQDINSQRVAGMFDLLPPSSKQLAVWDCCAASGGKSLLAIDYLTNINLTVTDIRESILQNLHQRFQRAGVKNYRSYVKDLSKQVGNLSSDRYDLIICDAPCSGSGTWSRTPEQLYYFDPAAIRHYSQLQQSIVDTVIPQLKKEGYFLYITCSVFAEENEMIVKHICDRHSMTLVKMELLKGYHDKADTLFAALFTASRS